MENKVHILTVVSDPTGDYQMQSGVMQNECAASRWQQNGKIGT